MFLLNNLYHIAVLVVIAISIIIITAAAVPILSEKEPRLRAALVKSNERYSNSSNNSSFKNINNNERQTTTIEKQQSLQKIRSRNLYRDKMGENINELYQLFQLDVMSWGVDNTSPEEVEQQETLVVITKYGNIRIVMRPDLSPESVDYIKELVATTGGCTKCTFYRSEKDSLLQGMMKNPEVETNQVFGKCPDPEYQPQDKCHGPIMTQGMVGWASGKSGGPNWFINISPKPVVEQQYTVWGELQDEESLSIIRTIQDLPITTAGVSGFNYLDEKIDLTLEMQ